MVAAVSGISVDSRGSSSVRILEDVTFQVAEGETVAIVGESGSGKSLTCRAIAGLLPRTVEVTRGSIVIDGEDITTMSRPQLRRFRIGRLSLMFQDPATALNPLLPVGFQIGEAVRAAGTRERAARHAVVDQLLVEVGISPSRAGERPYAFSGGMRQRIVAAVALALRPRLMIADEPTASLDAVTTRSFLEFLKSEQRAHRFALVYVTHDIEVAAAIADRIDVMYAGQIVESVPVAHLAGALHPYTRALTECSRFERPSGGRFATIPGAMPPTGSMPPGCRFAPRCPYAVEECTTAFDHFPQTPWPARCIRADSDLMAPAPTPESTGQESRGGSR